MAAWPAPLVSPSCCLLSAARSSVLPGDCASCLPPFAIRCCWTLLLLVLLLALPRSCPRPVPSFGLHSFAADPFLPSASPCLVSMVASRIFPIPRGLCSRSLAPSCLRRLVSSTFGVSWGWFGVDGGGEWL